MGHFLNRDILYGSHPKLHVPRFYHQHLVSGLQVNPWGKAYQQRQKKPEKHVDTISIPCIQLLPYVLKVQLIKLCALVHPPTNYSPDFDANARCVSNSGARSYDIENFKRLKNVVWHLFGFFSKVHSMFG